MKPGVCLLCKKAHACKRQVLNCLLYCLTWPHSVWVSAPVHLLVLLMWHESASGAVLPPQASVLGSTGAKGLYSQSPYLAPFHVQRLERSAWRCSVPDLDSWSWLVMEGRFQQDLFQPEVPFPFSPWAERLQILHHSVRCASPRYLRQDSWKSPISVGSWQVPQGLNPWDRGMP